MKKTITHRKIVFSLGLLLVCLAGTVPAHAQSQRLADPSYFYPGALWTKLEAAAPTAALAIINPNSGPGASLNSDYVKQVAAAKAHGLKVLGYVDTAYGKRAMSLVTADVNAFFNWYHVDGIMYDEVSNHEVDVPYYRTCYNLVHGLSSNAMVVLNPGTSTVEDYMTCSDVIITFESHYNEYLTQFDQRPWVTRYPAARFWHIILGAKTEAQMLDAVQKSKERHAGWVYVAPYEPPMNPYDKLPDDPYWASELSAVQKSGE